MNSQFSSGAEEHFISTHFLRLNDRVGCLSNQVSNLEDAVQKIEHRDIQMFNQLNHQNGLLAEHILGVNLTNERLKEERAARIILGQETQTRIATLERANSFWRTLGKYSLNVLIATGTSVSIVVGILSLF